MDQHILGLKSFIAGLGVHNVEFPSTLSEQELNLIVELFVTAASNLEENKAAGFETLLRKLVSRVYDEVEATEARQLLNRISGNE